MKAEWILIGIKDKKISHKKVVLFGQINGEKLHFYTYETQWIGMMLMLNIYLNH